MTVAEVREWLAENAKRDEVSSMLREFVPEPELTAERVERMFADDKTYRLLKPHVDRAVDKGIKTHDEKREPELQRQLEAEREKTRREATMSEAERAEQRFKELERKIAERDQALARRDLVEELRRIADEKHVPLDIAVDLNSTALTKEYAIERIERYADAHREMIDAEVKARLAGSPKPKSGNPPVGSGDIKKLSFEELVALEEKGELNAKLE